VEKFEMTSGRWRWFAAIGAALTLLTGATSRLAAQGTVTGRVTGSGQPLADARVLLIGTTISATTSDNGTYTLRGVPVGTQQLQVLRVGFQSQKKAVAVTAGAPVQADFTLEVAVAQLQEVVTTATGQQRKVELGNAISTLGDVGKHVEEVPTHNLTDLMIAKSPGVTILPGTELGAAPTVRIRGVSSISLSNAPIWYVDGVRYAANGLSSGTDAGFSLLNTLNPDEIEDIEIVKGPSAATLYGTNAANGVVVITTKKGRAGATHWNWSAEGRTVDDRVPYQDMYANWGKDVKTGVSTRCQLATMVTSANPGGSCKSDSLTHYNYMTDPERTFVHLGHGSLFGGNVNGGNDAVRFFVSGDLDNETGPLQMQNFEVARFDSLHVGVRDEWFHPSAQQRNSFRGNVSASLTPKFDLNFSSGFSQLYNRIPPESDLIIALYYVGMQNYGYKGCPGGYDNVTRFCGLDKTPVQADGTPLNDALQWAPGDIMQVTQQSNVQRFTGSSTGTWRPLSWMQNEGTVGVDLSAINFYQLCRLNECPPQSSTARLGRITDNQSKARNFSAKFSSTSTYNYSSALNLKTSVGGDYTNIENDFANTGGTILGPGATTVAAASTRSASQQQPTVVKTLGFYVQEQASIRDRLFLTAAIRTDQNSAFGTNFQQVYYPKLSASWVVSDESFFPQMSWLNQFRLRSAFGASGVQPGAIAGLITYAPATVTIAGRGTTTGTDTPGLTASQPGNADLRPERSTEFEGGFDAQLLSNKLHFEYTYWNKKTSDALINVSLAPSSAAAQLGPLLNIGSTQGMGHEVSANAQLLERRNFGWDVLVSASHFSNKIRDLGIDPNTGVGRILRTASGSTSGEVRQIAGHPINEQWYRPFTYADDNHDGIIQVNEVHVDSAFKSFGYRVPRDIFSVQNGFDLFARRIRLNMMFDYKGGSSILDGANNFQCNTAPFACRDTQDPNAPLALQAAAIAKTFGTSIGGTNYKTSAGYFHNNQFWKFRELSVVAQLPQMVTSRLRAQKGSTLVFGARNLHTWSNWTGIDPEANYGLTQSEAQNEFQTTGAPTYFTLRLNLKY
jgi:TonB-linked SusC/RagA family outer membrane protein